MRKIAVLTLEREIELPRQMAEKTKNLAHWRAVQGGKLKIGENHIKLQL
jgi:hypothetical protein